MTGRVITLGTLWTYVLIVGFTPPTVRAGLMITLFYFLLSFGLSRQFLNRLGISALLMLSFDPISLYSPSFQFSYLCLTAIGLCVVPYQPLLRNVSLGFRDCFTDRLVATRDPEAGVRRHLRYFLEEKLEFWPRPIVRPLIRTTGRGLAYFLGLALCSWFIQFFTIPLNLYYSNHWNWTQWHSNVILVPLFGLFIPLCLVLFLIFWLPGSSLLVSLVGSYADTLNTLMRKLERLAWTDYLPHPEPLELVVYFASFLGFFYGIRGSLRYLAFLSPILLLVLTQQPSSHPTGQLILTMLDVGQGESIHLRYPDGSDALVDTGGFSSHLARPSHFVGERLVSRYLWEEKTQSLRYVLLTHSDADHTQGYLFLKDVFPIKRLFFHDFQREYQGPAGHRLSAGDTFSVGGVEHLILHPAHRESPLQHSRNTNDRSLVILLRYKRFSMLLTGDIGSEVERKILPRLSHVTVLKAAHHGSRFSNSARFLKRTEPCVALISAGRKNVFGHPSTATLRRFNQLGIKSLATPEWGTLRIETDGWTWRVLHYSLRERAFCEIPLSTEDRVKKHPDRYRNSSLDPS